MFKKERLIVLFLAFGSYAVFKGIGFTDVGLSVNPGAWNAGAANGQFNQPIGIAVDSLNNVYVFEAGNFRIQKFDSIGNFITTWGSQGGGNGQFANPRGLAVDALGNVYVFYFGGEL